MSFAQTDEVHTDHRRIANVLMTVKQAPLLMTRVSASPHSKPQTGNPEGF